MLGKGKDSRELHIDSRILVRRKCMTNGTEAWGGDAMAVSSYW